MTSPTPARPRDLFGREAEWDDLVRFVTPGGTPMRLGVVLGRRRMGKSYLLRRLVRASGGFYTMAREQAREPALARFGDQLSERFGLGLTVTDWASGLRLALDLLAREAEVPLLVLDELPYLLAHSPELEGVLQELHDDRLDRGEQGRVIVCGSSLSVMTGLLAGQRPMRGRAQLQMRLGPFDHVDAARYWQLDAQPAVALQVHSVLGGTAGHRDLVNGKTPTDAGDGFAEWLSRTVLSPSHTLYGEADDLLREDPRVTDRALYVSVLAALAAGDRTPSRVAGRLGRDARSLAHVLDVLTTGGFVVNDDDVLRQRRPGLRLVDPIVRFHQVVAAPRIAQLEERRARAVWKAARADYRSQVLGVHLEQLVRAWVRRGGLGGLDTGEVGPTVLRGSGRDTMELDVVALAVGQRRHVRDPDVRLVGEVKASSRPMGAGQLDRLDEAVARLEQRGARVTDARRLLVNLGGFTASLRDAAVGRTDVDLVDLERLYAR